ncbi:MAG: AEC family transporter [Clostridia bacterium]|nr:AEC family transporter [Clostridia bacterium]
MSTVLIILKQIVVMFLIMGMGYILFKKKLITKDGSKTLANLLIYIILPCVIINGFIKERTPERIAQLGVSALLALVFLIISALVSRLIFKKSPIDNFAACFSNPGFFGIPLIVAAYSSEAVFYITAFIAFLNIGQWTYGAAVLKEEKVKVNFKTIFTSPFIIGLIIGLVIFFTQIPLPTVITSTIGAACNANTFIAMLVLGTYLAQTDLKSMFLTPKLYLLSFVRLALIPFICALSMLVMPESYRELCTCVMIACACPVGANVAVYAQLYGKDYGYAVQTVTLSTIFSLASIPLVLMVLNLM